MIASEQDVASFVLGPNCSVTGTGVPSVQFILANFTTPIYLTVINNGNVPVFLTSVTVTTNITGAGSVLLPIPASNASISPDFYRSYITYVNPSRWPLAFVKCLFVVSGNNVTGSAVLTLGVLSFPKSSTTSTTTTTTTSSVSGISCPFILQGH